MIKLLRHHRTNYVQGAGYIQAEEGAESDMDIAPYETGNNWDWKSYRLYK